MDSTPYRRIPLNQGFFALVDEADVPLLSQYSWLISRGTTHIYASHRPRGQKCIFMHRLIMDAKDDQYVDHINGETLDNRRANLRLCTRLENYWNSAKRRSMKGKPCSSRFKGVSKGAKSKKWAVWIKVDKVQKSLGRFDCEIEAARAYDTAAKQFFGPFARLNFPDQNQALPSASLSYAEGSSECETNRSDPETRSVAP